MRPTLGTSLLTFGKDNPTPGEETFVLVFAQFTFAPWTSISGDLARVPGAIARLTVLDAISNSPAIADFCQNRESLERTLIFSSCSELTIPLLTVLGSVELRSIKMIDRAIVSMGLS
jgi:hypothetical protein